MNDINDDNENTSSLMGNYSRSALAFERGDGAWLMTADGEKYLDCASGVAVTALGHNHPALVSALTEQAKKIWHVSNLYRIPEQEAAAELLAQLSGMDDAKVFFCNSGAEATEAVVKMARRYMFSKGETERHTILCATGAFHGRTTAMLAATHNPAFREGFGPMPGGFDHFPLGNMNVLRDMLAEDAKGGNPAIAAIMVEDIQGEGGVRPAGDDFYPALRATCDEFGCLLIADEVQTGIGRTGHIFSFERSGIKPDLIALAKGLGGGFPVGAAVARDEIAASMTPGSHGSTFGGNPLAMAVARAVLQELSAPGFMEDVRKRSARLMAGLREIAKANDDIFLARGAGFLIGLAMKPEVDRMAMLDALMERKVLSVPAADNTIRLLPPLIISDNEIDILLDAVAQSVVSISRKTE